MKKNVLIILIALFISVAPNHTQGQGQSIEFGVFGGTSFYMGDLNPSNLFEMPQPAFGGLVRYNLSSRTAIKINGYYGHVAGDDAITKHNVNRNLHFRSHIMEFGANFEFNFFRYVTGHNDYFITPYIFGGIAVFNFNPKAEYEGEWYELQPLGTEGQGTVYYYDREPYSLTTLALPFGVGLKYSLSNTISIGLEWGMRKTNTDYLDDVSTTYADPNIIAAENGPVAAALSDRSFSPVEGESNVGMQRGDSQNKDWYSFAGLQLTLKFNYSRRGDCPAYHRHIKYREYFLR